MDMSKPVSLLNAMRDFFGLKISEDGTKQTLSEFMAETKKLDDGDRGYFKTHLQAAGYVII